MKIFLKTLQDKRFINLVTPASQGLTTGFSYGDARGRLQSTHCRGENLLTEQMVVQYTTQGSWWNKDCYYG